MRVVNNLTKPGDIRRVDLTTDFVRVVFSDNTEKIYRDVTSHYRDQASLGYADAMADMRKDSL